MDSNIFGPLNQWARDAIIGKQDGTPLIVGLLRRGRPPAIGRLIVAIIVNTVKRVFGARPRTHIGKEILKGIAPALAYRDAATAIIMILPICFAMAALKHTFPRAPFWRIGHVMSAALAYFSKALNFLATAICNMAIAQALTESDKMRTARANTQPTSATIVARSNMAYNGQTAKAQAGYIFNLFVRDGNNLRYSGDGHCNLNLHCSGRERSRKSLAAILFVGIPIIAQMGEAK